MSVLDPTPPLPTLWRDKLSYLRVPRSQTSLGFTAMSDEPGVLFMGARSKVSHVVPVQARGYWVMNECLN
jgi:hypothetical protein